MCQRLSDDLRPGQAWTPTASTATSRQQPAGKNHAHRSGRASCRILIATDVASRGIDVDDVDCVINYDVPAGERILHPPHWPYRPGQEEGRGHAPSSGNFPEQAKLDEIAKYSHYEIQRVKFLDDGTLVEEEVKKPKPAPRRRFR